MIELLVGVLALIPLEVTGSPSPAPVAPVGTHGFAAAILGGFFGLGILILAAVFTSLKPRRVPAPRMPPAPRQPPPD